MTAVPRQPLMEARSDTRDERAFECRVSAFIRETNGYYGYLIVRFYAVFLGAGARSIKTIRERCVFGTLGNRSNNNKRERWWRSEEGGGGKNIICRAHETGILYNRCTRWLVNIGRRRPVFPTGFTMQRMQQISSFAIAPGSTQTSWAANFKIK